MVTLGQAHNKFMIELDKRPISAAPSFLQDEIDYFINKAYLALIHRKFTGNNPIQTGFEQSSKRLADLQPLVTYRSNSEDWAASIYSSNGLLNTGIITDEVLIPVSCQINAGNGVSLPTITITHADIDKFQVSEINNPWIPVPAVLFEDRGIHIFVQEEDVQKYLNYEETLILTFIKKPTVFDSLSAGGMNATFEVNWVDEIISLAVDYALDNIEAQRVQTHPNLSTNSME